jgi:hypothetical protein
MKNYVGNIESNFYGYQDFLFWDIKLNFQFVKN